MNNMFWLMPTIEFLFGLILSLVSLLVGYWTIARDRSAFILAATFITWTCGGFIAAFGIYQIVHK
jgi:uncharacterized protein YybS (DUF2232 family)